MEHTDAGVRTPPVGLRTREEEEHDSMTVGRPVSALGSRPGVLGLTRPPAPRTPLNPPPTAEPVTAGVYELAHSSRPGAFATARHVETAGPDLAEDELADDEATDEDDVADDELDDELAGPAPASEGTATGRPVLAEVIDIGLGDLLGEVMEWQERALCAQTDPEAFFPEKGGSTREAKRICSGCEVRAECLEYALANDERFGIWGGMSERERRKQRRRAV
jgi:WhiB family redox-sensing transcriptional regulator